MKLPLKSHTAAINNGISMRVTYRCKYDIVSIRVLVAEDGGEDSKAPYVRINETCIFVKCSQTI